MPPKAKEVYVVYQTTFAGDPVFAEVCTKQETADTVAQNLQRDGYEVNISTVAFDASAKTKSSSKKTPTKTKEKSAETIDNSATEDEVLEAEPKAKKVKTPKKKAASDDDEKEDRNAARKVVPDGVKGALNGLKYLFTGTMELDRTTMQNTATKYGGQFAKKVEDADVVVLGKKPGPKKMEEINNAGKETITEDEFMERIKGGSASSEPPKKKLKT